MEFKAGDRVHVTKLNYRDVDFYGTLEQDYGFSGLVLYKLVNCSNSDYENETVRKEESRLYRKEDYYALATDEEDAEEPVYILDDVEIKDIVAIVADKYHKGSVAHNVASALEYLMRAPEKHGPEDIKKARKCLDFAIENWK